MEIVMMGEGEVDQQSYEEAVDRVGKQKKGRIATLDLKREDFGLFRALLGRIPLETVVEKRGIQVSWLVFRDHLLQAQ